MTRHQRYHVTLRTAVVPHYTPVKSVNMNDSHYHCRCLPTAPVTRNSIERKKGTAIQANCRYHAAAYVVRVYYASTVVEALPPTGVAAAYG